MAEYTNFYTVWSRWGLTNNADDRPLIRHSDGTLSWPSRGSVYTRDIARFETETDAQCALRSCGDGHRRDSSVSVVKYPFREDELSSNGCYCHRS